MSNELKIDHNNCIDANDRQVGFVYQDGVDGGYFFTMMDSLEATLDSVEPCSIDGDGGIDREAARSLLRKKLPYQKREWLIQHTPNGEWHRS